MSSDGYFDDDDGFDAAALEQIDAIEAAALGDTQTQQAPQKPQQQPATSRPKPAPLASDSSIDMTFDIDESELAQMDEFVAQAYQAKPVAGPSSRPMHRTNSSSMVQTTLFGGVVQPKPSSSKAPSQSQQQRSKPASTSGGSNPFGKPAQKTKTWDHTAFSETGKKKKAAKGKGKQGEDDEDDDDGFQLPAPFVPIGPWPPPMRLKPDLLEAKHWIFPTNRSKRDYQFNIVRHCLFENTLVALPTGLGKTFIAGVVMLNYYRWFPEGKIIFLATTKPLVAQQVEACHETCGIPGSDGIEMTGEVRRDLRARYWDEKRVFYMTSQTLESDLKTGLCRPEDVILLVVDEAHHASGNHTYNQVVRFMTAKNPHFRILALTATPANNPDGVQGIVDGLHISHIEIRNEKSLDIKPYIFDKVIKSHIIRPTGEVALIRDMLAKYIDRIAGPLRSSGVYISQAVKLHPFQPMALMKKPEGRRFMKQLKQLSTLGRAMLYLLTGCITACHDYLLEAQKQDEDQQAEGKKTKPMWIEDQSFKEIMLKLKTIQEAGGAPHPKMEKLKDILINYFGARMQDPNPEDGAANDATCVIVFSSFRAVVEEIVRELAGHAPLIRAAAFVGQATDKKGRKGLTQKGQHQLIKEFKEGKYNVIVATSIGEEGLDIGEVDCTVCYDTDKAPIRMVQRFGRTGRKRAGEVHLLLAEAREEDNADKAKDIYNEVQKVILKGETVELFGDVPRLIPDHIKPECLEKVMEIQPYVRETKVTRTKSTGKTAPKRKRNDDPGRNIPPDMPTSFTSAGTIWEKFKKRKAEEDDELEERPMSDVERDLDAALQDGESDEDLENGSFVGPSRRTQSEKTTSTAKKKSGKEKGGKKGAVKRSKTEGAEPEVKKRKGKGKKKAQSSGDENGEEETRPPPKLSEITSSQLATDDDDLDMEIEYGTFLRDMPRKTPSAGPSNGYNSDSAGAFSRPRLSPVVEGDVIDLSDTDDETPEVYSKPSSREDSTSRTTPSPRASPPLKRKLSEESFSPPLQAKSANDMSWLVDDDDDELDSILIINSSPIAPRKPSPRKFQRLEVGDDSIEISEPILTQAKLGTSRVSFASTKRSQSPTSKKPLSKKRSDMGPPALPSRRKQVPPTPEAPALTYPVQAPAAKRRRVIQTLPSSDEEEEELKPPPLSQPRLSQFSPSTPAPRPKKPKRTKPSLLAKRVNPLFDGEAAHSGDEESEGVSGSEEEDEYDRSFIKDSPMTQMSPSYEQTQIYRQSLLTQVPGGAGRQPLFANGPARSRPFGRLQPKNKVYLLSSSPPPEGEDEPNEYEHGSFVVGDDDISMEATGSDDALLDI